MAAGASLAHTLHHLPVTILLSGELGAGKTTFVQGFAKELGITDLPGSPTYALEQRYATERFGEFLHMDLYRLSAKDARELIQHSERHEGIRCIEWPEKVEMDLPSAFPSSLHIVISEKEEERTLSISFDPLPLPSDEDIQRWRKELYLPTHVQKHCDAVTDMAMELAEKLLKQGTIVRKETLRKAALLHDLLRFIDFREHASPADFKASAEEKQVWNTWKERYAGQKHEAACASFLREKGYPELAQIIEPHGLAIPSPDRFFTEQKLLYYADKRVIQDRPVTLAERFADFRMRYGRGKESEEAKFWFEEAQHIEQELFP